MFTRAPSLGSGKGRSEAGLAFFFWRRSGSLVNDALEPIFLALFHTASTLSAPFGAPSPRGEGFVRRYCFSTYACIRSDNDNVRKAMLSYRSLPHWGRGTASAVDRVLSYIVDLRRISPLSFIPLVPYPARSTRHLPLEGEGFVSRIALFSYRCLSHTGKAKKERRFAPIHICGEAAAKSLKTGIRD